MKKVNFINLLPEKENIKCIDCNYKTFSKEKRELFICTKCNNKYVCETCITVLASEYICTKCLCF